MTKPAWPFWPDIFKRREEFTRLTALHHAWDQIPTWQRQVIEAQAQTIRNYRVMLNQQRRGYQRKIAKLHKRIAELEAS